MNNIQRSDLLNLENNIIRMKTVIETLSVSYWYTDSITET